jgi:acyl-CoA thioester hydrolase
MTSVPGPVAAYPFVHWEEVRFRDLDALGHVNNAVYASYLESARIAYYQQLTGQPLEQLGLILGELTIRYRAPAFFGDRLAVGARVTSLGTKSFVMEYAITRAADEALIATARTVLVAYDYKLAKSVPVPEAVRRVLEEQRNRGAEEQGY